MRFGLLIGLLGGAMTAVAILAAEDGAQFLALGAILLGVVLFFVGLGQLALYRLKGSDARAAHHREADRQAILRAMLAIAAADGSLDAREIALIRDVSEAMLDGPFSEAQIRAACGEMRRGEINIYQEMSSRRAELTPLGAELAVKAAMMVALADGALHDEEEKEILSMAQVLRVEDARLQAALTEARAAAAEMLEGGQPSSA